MKYKIIVDTSSGDRFETTHQGAELDAKLITANIDAAIKQKDATVAVDEKTWYVVSEIISFSYEVQKPWYSR